MTFYSDRMRRALRFAEREHRGSVRKGTKVPYIVHPVAVAALLAAAGAPEPVIVAGYLHDVAEDEDVTLDEIEAAFGADVRALVEAVTEVKQDARSGEDRPWSERKREVLAHLADAPTEVLWLKAADVSVNVGDLIADHERIGPQVWARFNGRREEQLEYYARLMDVLAEGDLLPLLRDELESRRFGLAGLRATADLAAG